MRNRYISVFHALSACLLVWFFQKQWVVFCGMDEIPYFCRKIEEAYAKKWFLVSDCDDGCVHGMQQVQ
jgi:hypothetical protein